MAERNMSWTRFFRRRHWDEERARELEAYVQIETDENIARGMSPEEARYAAHRKLGNTTLIREEIYRMNSLGWLEILWQDMRYGLRQVKRNAGFSVVVVITLALGIGGNVAVFSLLDAVLLHQLTYSQPDRLFRLYPTESRGAMEASSYPDFQDWQKQSHTFEAMAGFHEDSINLTGTSDPERLKGLFSTPGLFALLGIHPLLGREFSPDDNQHVAVLSYELWQRRFTGNAGIIGKPIYLDGWACTVLGVLPPHSYFPPNRWGGAPEVFVPALPDPDRGWNYLRVIGRLAPSATEQQAQTEMKGIAARLAQVYPKTNRDRGIVLESLGEVVVSGMRQTGWVLLGVVAFVLLIACANVANLLLSRGAVREREIAIRSLVGATRSRLVRQLLTESLLLAGLGGAMGVVLAQWVLPVMAFAVPEHTGFFTRVQDVGIHLNFAVLAFSALVTALSIALFGVLPAWRATKPLQSSVARFQAVRIRGALIALEVALSFVLLAGAGLMMKSLVRLLGEDVGFRTEHLLTMDVSLSEAKYSTPEKQTAYFDQVLQRLTAMPAVLSVGAVTDLPLTRNETWNGFEIPGPHPSQGRAGYHAVSSDYFRTMGISLLNGRELGIADSARSPLVGVINRSMASKYWPNENPIGKTIEVYRVVVERTPEGEHVQFKPHMLEIVGVVSDVRQLALEEPPDPELFIPYAQWPSSEMSLVLRAESEPSSLIPRIKKEIWRVDSDQPVTDLKTMNELVATEAATRRFVLQLVGTFALIAIVLAAVGIYGVASYWMRQRTHEIGIRMALGAEGHGIVWMLVRQNAMWVLIGITAGVAGAFAMTRLLAGYLYAVRPTDPTTFIAVGVLLSAVALVASYIPARRATKVDPMVALRYE
jgi:putative ABC transport system permease protein